MLDMTGGSETEDDLELMENNKGRGTGGTGGGGGILDLTELDSPDFNATNSSQDDGEIEIGDVISDSEDEDIEEEIGGGGGVIGKVEEKLNSTSIPLNGSSTGGGGGSAGRIDAMLVVKSNVDAMNVSTLRPEASTSNLSHSIQSQSQSESIQQSSSTSSSSSLSTAYLSALSHRHSLFSPPPNLSSAKSYSIESIFTIPQSTHTHAIALPPCTSHLYAGGQDGIIRRYAVHPTLNSSPSHIAASNNLTMKAGTGLPPGEVKLPVLIGCYENEEPGIWSEGDLVGGGSGGEKVIWGPKSYALRESPVYSLAVHSEELWGLSGTGKGSINLFTIRHDEGQIRHVFKSSNNLISQGHHSKSPVSCITLTSDQHSFLSGGWDSRILDWDLDTGIATSDYIGHTGQISSIFYRPLSSSFSTSTPTLSQKENENENEDVEMDLDDLKPSLSIITTLPTSTTTTPALSSISLDRNVLSATDQPQLNLTSPISSPDSSTGVAAALVQVQAQVQSPSTSAAPALSVPVLSAVPVPAEPVVGGGGGDKINVDADVDIDADADADGSEADADGDDDDDDEDDLMNGITTATDKTSIISGVPIDPLNLPSTSTTTTTTTTTTPGLKPKPSFLNSIPIIGNESSKLPDLSKGDGNVFMSTSIDGQVLIWDKRIRNGGSKEGGVRRFGKTKFDNWCASATWSTSGQQIYVGRRNSSIEIFDLRHSTPSQPTVQTLRLPISSGPITAIATLPSGKHIISASGDILRLWDLDLARELEARGGTCTTGGGGGSRAYKIVVGHQGATGPALPKCVVSQLYVDPKAQFLISSSGNRGWEGNSTENLIIHEIKSFY